ncbi:MAG: hypothetical protein J7551_01495 [Chloroflexi bacterium]|nr:hypothetical protein [Chloroflexota bacterium]
MPDRIAVERAFTKPAESHTGRSCYGRGRAERLCAEGQEQIGAAHGDRVRDPKLRRRAQRGRV